MTNNERRGSRDLGTKSDIVMRKNSIFRPLAMEKLYMKYDVNDMRSMDKNAL